MQEDRGDQSPRCCRSQLGPAWLLLTASIALWGCKSSGNGNLQSETGSGVANPESLSFGSVPVGDTSVLSLQIYNAGLGPLTLGNVQLSSSDFRVMAPFAPSQLPGGQSAIGQVSFTPSMAGPVSGTLTLATTIAAGAVGTPVVVQLSGTAVAIADIHLQVDPLEVPFGQVQVGQRASAKVRLNNLNKFPIQVVYQGPDGGQAADFEVDNAPPQLGVAQSADIQLSFVPSQAASESTGFGFAACQLCPVQLASLSGQGINGQLTLQPSGLDFGFVLNNPLPLPTLPVTATFAGDATLTVTAISLSTSSAFKVVDLQFQGQPQQPPFVFKPNDAGAALPSFGFSVSYSPSGLPQGDSDEVTIAYQLENGTPRTALLPLVGNPPRRTCHLVVTPENILDLGTLAPGTTNSRSVSIINTGDTDCALNGLALLDPVDPAFVVGRPAADGGLQLALVGGSATVLAHGSVDVPITFTAPADSPLRARNSSLVFSSSDPALPSQNILLTGEVVSAYASDSLWPRWHHDNQNSGQSEIDTSAIAGLPAWQFDLQSSISAAAPACTPKVGSYYQNGPALAGNRLYQLGCDGVLHALDSTSGLEVWHQPLPRPDPGTLTTPVIGPDDLLNFAYVSSNGVGPFPGIVDAGLSPDDAGVAIDKELRQLSPVTHHVIWTADNSDAQHDVFIASASSTLPAFSLQGQALYGFAGNQNVGGSTISELQGWLQRQLGLVFDFQTSNPSPPFNSVNGPGPAVDDDGTSYWCSQGKCVAMSAGLQPLWYQGKLATGDASLHHGAPAIGSGMLYYLTVSVDRPVMPGESAQPFYHARLYCLSRTSPGAVQWSYDLPLIAQPPPSGPYAKADVYAQAWNLISSPAVALDGAVIVPFLDGVYAIEGIGANAGRLRWRAPVPDGVLGSASLGREGTVYIGTVSQGLLALDLATGAPKWHYLPGGKPVSISSVPIIGSSQIYFTADDGFLYAIH